MADIYKRAYKVVIWLGQDDEQAKEAFTTLKLFARVGEQKLDVSQTYWIAHRSQTESLTDTSTIVPSLNFNDTLRQYLSVLPTIQSNEWNSVLSILSRSWFKRLWTFQEAVLGSQLTELRCGDLAIKAYNFDFAVTALSSCGYARSIQFDHPASQALSISEFIRICRTWKKGKAGPESSLRDLLVSVRRLRCKDPHDKVYAILGVCKPEYLTYIQIDYDQSLAELYGSVVKASILVDKDLCIFHSVHHWNNDDMPSWIPDLHDSRHAYGFYFGQRSDFKNRFYTASRESVPALTLSTDPSSLMLRGVRFRKITRVVFLKLSEGPWTDFTGWHKRFQVGARYFKLPRRPGNTNVSILANDYLTYSDRSSVQTPTDENVDAAILRRVVTADVYPRPGKQRFHRLDNELPAFYTWQKTGFKGDVPLDVLREEINYEDKVMRSRLVCVVGEEPDDTYNGVVPGDARAGDWVCVLFGGDAPFMLREVEGDSETGGMTRWQFIGECFVDGIMDGEALVGKVEDDFEMFTLV